MEREGNCTLTAYTLQREEERARGKGWRTHSTMSMPMGGGAGTDQLVGSTCDDAACWNPGTHGQAGRAIVIRDPPCHAHAWAGWVEQTHDLLPRGHPLPMLSALLRPRPSSSLFLPSVSSSPSMPAPGLFLSALPLVPHPPLSFRCLPPSRFPSPLDYCYCFCYLSCVSSSSYRYLYYYHYCSRSCSCLCYCSC